jgi:hypothetical protein
MKFQLAQEEYDRQLPKEHDDECECEECYYKEEEE